MCALRFVLGPLYFVFLVSSLGFHSGSGVAIAIDKNQRTKYKARSTAEDASTLQQFF